ncbi:MAG: MBL fold metallo-hydrolase [Firmicutes bacterium]|jgi:two-component system cell cycle response regulator|nr:MBL fold metallo-hydrolase [Bacillota bacterium]
MQKPDLDRAIEIAPGTYWVGFDDEKAGLRCNPYIIVDGDEAVLIEPGSVPHFPIVLRKVASVVDLREISTIIVSHQDPDLCAAIPRFEEVLGPGLKVATHSRAAILIQHYGLSSPFYHVDQNGWELTLKSGRKLKFIFAPYLHFPGAFMTYDPVTKILFSGDLFGAFSFDWSLYAGEFYEEAMKAFHENYMPSQEILARAMDKLEHLEIAMIAPQHGSIICDNPRHYINVLRNLDCGDYMLE